MTTPIRFAREARVYRIKSEPGFGIGVTVRARSKEEAGRMFDMANPVWREEVVKHHAKRGVVAELDAYNPNTSWRKTIRSYGEEEAI